MPEYNVGEGGYAAIERDADTDVGALQLLATGIAGRIDGVHMRWVAQRGFRYGIQYNGAAGDYSVFLAHTPTGGALWVVVTVINGQGVGYYNGGASPQMNLILINLAGVGTDHRFKIDVYGTP